MNRKIMFPIRRMRIPCFAGRNYSIYGPILIIRIMLLILFKKALIVTMLSSTIYCGNESNMNLKTCKVTHSGVSFTGTVSKTSQGLHCLRWASIGKLNSKLKDEDFPDRSLQKARNYCRNPTEDEIGPWCYIAGPSLVKQQCGVPLCASHCRLTGPGVEYAGITSNAIYRHCEKWNNDWHKRKINLLDDNITYGITYSDDRFPDKNIDSASNYCRNPDGSIGGPWCYVLSDVRDVFVKSYCDVPDCDERDNYFISKQNNFYSHFISYKGSEPNNITFAVRLWNPDLEHKAAIKILLSTLNVPTSKENIRKWGTAVELTISNNGTGITIGNHNQFLEPTVDILKATEYTSFVVLWKNNVLNLFTSSDATESVYVETLADLPVIGNEHLSLRYFSMSGDVAMWDFPPRDDDMCQEHTTYLPSPIFTWKLRQDGVKFYLELFVRSFHSALIFLTCGPYHDYPRLSIEIGFPESVTAVVYQSTETVQSRVATTNFRIDYWSWTRLRIILLGKEVRLMTHDEEVGSFIPLLTLNHKIASSLRWFSIGSNQSLTHWAFYCEPPNLPTAYPPNCAITYDAVNYKGDQWVSHSGLPCLPWFVVEPNHHEDALELNYCRNFKAMRPAPWCYVQTSSGIKPEICNVRKCNALLCKKAGTANDYVGDLAVTRSNRTCKKWPRSFMKRHKHEMYPGYFFEGNFCRNPTRDIGGAWCFTTDSDLLKDLCHVKDCDKRESRIVITNHKGDLRYTHVIPKWRDSGDNGGLHFSLKRWDPTLPEGILFNIFPMNKSSFLSLYIGAENNEELILRYTEYKSNDNVLLVRKIFPHIIPGGKWREFRLQMLTGRIRLGYETKNFTILDWKADKPYMMFNPAFISYESIGRDVVGIYFHDLECHVENTSALFHSRVYPISWQNDDDSSSDLTLYIRGTGIAIIPLVHFPSQTEDYLVVFIDNLKKQISLDNSTILGTTKLCTEEVGDDLISHSEWNRYDIYSKNNSLYVLRNNIQLVKWDSPRALVYYFFSVAAQLGWIVWTANCRPPDIDSALQNGGWSPWSEWYCSVSCGKGVGYRQRKCDNPKPTIFGKPCSGPLEESGVCNDFECGHISPQTYDLIRKYLQTKLFNIIAKEGCNITFKAAPVELMTYIKAESPTSEIIWMHKGMPLKPMKGKYYINDLLEVAVTNITQFDDGLYVCVMKSTTDVNSPIKAVVVAVEPSRPDVTVYNGSSFEMTCTSALPTIFADLWIKWYHNDKLFASTDIATIYFKNNLRIPVALWNHTGIWKCVMEQTDLNLRWVVQIHNVLVTSEPSFLSVPLQAYAYLQTLNLMQCNNPSQLYYIITACAVIFTLSFLIVIGILICRSYKITKRSTYEKIAGTDLSYADTATNINVPGGEPKVTASEIMRNEKMAIAGIDLSYANAGNNKNVLGGEPKVTASEIIRNEKMAMDPSNPGMFENTDPIKLYTKLVKENIPYSKLQEGGNKADSPGNLALNTGQVHVPVSPNNAKLNLDVPGAKPRGTYPTGIDYKRENKLGTTPSHRFLVPNKGLDFARPDDVSPVNEKQKIYVNVRATNPTGTNPAYIGTKNKIGILPKDPNKGLNFASTDNYVTPVNKPINTDTICKKTLPVKSSGPKLLGVKIEFLKKAKIYKPLECPELCKNKADAKLSCDDLLFLRGGYDDEKLNSCPVNKERDTKTKGKCDKIDYASKRYQNTYSKERDTITKGKYNKVDYESNKYQNTCAKERDTKTKGKYNKVDCECKKYQNTYAKSYIECDQDYTKSKTKGKYNKVDCECKKYQNTCAKSCIESDQDTQDADLSAAYGQDHDAQSLKSRGYYEMGDEYCVKYGESNNSNIDCTDSTCAYRRNYHVMEAIIPQIKHVESAEKVHKDSNVYPGKI